jgi:hypothetical protein
VPQCSPLGEFDHIPGNKCITTTFKCAKRSVNNLRIQKYDCFTARERDGKKIKTALLVA